MKNKTLFFLLFLSVSLKAQKLVFYDDRNEYGQTRYFRFGDVQTLEEKPEIDIRANATNIAGILLGYEEFNKYRGFNFHYYPNCGSWQNLICELEYVVMKIGPKIHETNCCVFNIELNSRKSEANTLFAIGQLAEDFSDAKKIKILEITPDIGREVDYGKFEKLQEIRTQHHFSYNGYNQEKLYHGLEFTYPGDPFFWSDLAKAEKLELIRFSSRTFHFGHNLAGNLYFLDGFNSEILELENMHSISLSGLSFFSVNFFLIEKLKFLELESISQPELLNLALVLSHFNENVTLENCKNYVSVVDTSQTINLSENGSFRTEYKNGQTLCEGSFKNSVPDGNWKFWYEDGLLCQERSYDAGQPIGKWTLRGPHIREYLPDGNILTEFTYANGKLVNRKDFQEDFFGYNRACVKGEDDPMTFTQSEYKLFWGEGNNVEIERRMFSIIIEKNKFNTVGEQFGDTLTQLTENWSFDSENWTYKYTDGCNGRIDYTGFEQRGKIGKEAYYQKVVDQYTSFKTISVIDLKNRTWEYLNYDKNASDSFELTHQVKNVISFEEWSVDIK